MISIYLKHQQKQFLKFRKPQEFLQSFFSFFSSWSFFKPSLLRMTVFEIPSLWGSEGRWRKGGGLGPERVSQQEGRARTWLINSSISPDLVGSALPFMCRLNITQRLPDPSGLGDYLQCSFSCFYCVECGREISHYLKPSPDLDPDCQFIHYHGSCI